MITKANLRAENETASPKWHALVRPVLYFRNILSEEEIKHGLSLDDCKEHNLTLAESVRF